MRGSFLVPTGELFRHRGTRQPVTLVGPLPGLVLSTTRLTGDDVVADLVLEAQGETVTATGTVMAGWEGDCRRCLEATGGVVTVEVSEVFEPVPVEGETYPLGPDRLDLAPALREALALALPLAPLCDEGCAGPDPVAHPVAPAGDDDQGEPPADPRWAALDALRFDG
ncbi:MAG TPA: YceD family protein [Acidimicrobiales bacterium]|nr:YceD family protein [Acidimicrobiales bacterium]